MPGAREAAAVLRGVQQRVQRIEDSVGTDEGIPRILRSVSDTSVTSDSTSRTVQTASPGAWDSDDWDGTLEWG